MKHARSNFNFYLDALVWVGLYQFTSAINKQSFSCDDLSWKCADLTAEFYKTLSRT